MAFEIPSTIKDTLLSFVNTLSVMKDVNGNLLFSTTAIWNNHLKKLIDGSGYSFLTPAAFVEVVTKSRQVLGNGVSTQDIDIIFHVLHMELDAINGTLDQNINVFDYRTYLRNEFTNFNVINCNTLQFMSEKEDYSHKNVYHLTQTWRSKYNDISGCLLLNGTYITVPFKTNLGVTI